MSQKILKPHRAVVWALIPVRSYGARSVRTAIVIVRSLSGSRSIVTVNIDPVASAIVCTLAIVQSEVTLPTLLTRRNGLNCSGATVSHGSCAIKR